MPSLAGLAQQVNGSACNHFAAMANEGLKHFLEIQRFGFAVYKGHHVDTEYHLHGSLGIEVIQHHIGHFPLAQFDDDTHAILV